MSTKRRGSEKDLQKNTYVFGNERIIIGSQVYRSFYLSPLLIRTIFGSPLFSSLSWYELKYEKKTLLLFIYIHTGELMIFLPIVD